TLGYGGIIVLIDRVDEPQQIEGDPRKMRALIWPLLDHKFLRHPGIGFKLLRWSGPSLYDLASDRLRACRIAPSADGDPAGDGASAAASAVGDAEHDGPQLRNLVDETISDDYLKDALGNLRTPRHLFKFLHRLIEEHCQRHTADQPRWAVDHDTFRTTFSSYMRDLEAFDRGYGHG